MKPPAASGPRIDKPQNPVGQRHAGHQLLFMGGGGIHRGKADAFTGNGNILGIGGGDNAFRATLENGRHLGIVEDDLSIGLVGDQVDDVTIIAAFSASSFPNASKLDLLYI